MTDDKDDMPDPPGYIGRAQREVTAGEMIVRSLKCSCFRVARTGELVVECRLCEIARLERAFTSP